MRPILVIIVVAQFFCTSLWFAGNAVAGEIIQSLKLAPRFLGHMTSAVQLGFISGTLWFAIAGIADRYAPSRVFFYSSICAAAFNAAITLPFQGAFFILVMRFFTGFFLAGIYPVGMKIASDYFREGLGKSLGYLVGALVLGTALPHLLKSISLHLSWNYVFLGTTILSITGGILMLWLVPVGPHRKPGKKVMGMSIAKPFRHKPFKAVAFGYFGHMWELYTLWAFVPVMLTAYAGLHPGFEVNIPLLSFATIGIGAAACVMAGIISQKTGAEKIARFALAGSGICCLISPLIFLQGYSVLFIVFMLMWGILVIADSPMFSTLVANHAPAEERGTALTLVTCIGFAITIVSILLLNNLREIFSPEWLFLFLLPGPVFGLLGMYADKNNLSDPKK